MLYSDLSICWILKYSQSPTNETGEFQRGKIIKQWFFLRWQNANPQFQKKIVERKLQMRRTSQKNDFQLPLPG